MLGLRRSAPDLQHGVALLLGNHAFCAPSSEQTRRSAPGLDSQPFNSKSCQSMTFDLVLRGGTLYDGSGRAGELGDLAITDGRIAAIGRRRRAAPRLAASSMPAPRGSSSRRASSISQHRFGFHAADQSHGREQGAPGRHHRGDRPLRLFGRAGAAGQGGDAA